MAPLVPEFDQPTSSEVRALVVDAVRAAAELIADRQTAVAWNEPSVLDGMTVGALSAHLLRAAGATVAYLDRTPADARPGDDLLTPVTYFRAALEAPIHDRIKGVSAEEAAIGPDATAAACRHLVDTLATRLAEEPEDRLVGALGGRMLTLDDFCRTRLIEVLLHVDDLACSVGLPRPDLDRRGARVVASILVGIAADRHGEWGLLHALARVERADPDVFPIL